MYRSSTQDTLFNIPASVPNGLVYRPDFLTPDEEEVLLAYIGQLPLEHPLYEGAYAAKRRIMNFGWGFNFKTQKIIQGPPLPHFLQPLQRKIGKRLGIPTRHVVEALVTEYTPGAAIGWHRDNEGFEHIVGVSLGSWCTMQFRPIRSRQVGKRKSADIIELDLEPRSAYLMQNDIRWHWQHHVPKVANLRYSITFRTLPKGVTLPH